MGRGFDASHNTPQVYPQPRKAKYTVKQLRRGFGASYTTPQVHPPSQEFPQVVNLPNPMDSDFNRL